MPWLDGLDPTSDAYRIASDDSHRIRLIAGPGTGKSFILKRRVARLVEEGLDPTRLLAVTFTRVAADDLHRELRSLDIIQADEISAATLHSTALRILARPALIEALGRHGRPLNDFELRPLVCDLASAFGGIRAVKVALQAYQAAWSRMQHEPPGPANNEADVEFSGSLENWLVFHRCMLIGEVIPMLLDYMRENPESDIFNTYDYVLVDEFQDLNRAEQELLYLLSRDIPLFIVGDDDQSIYSFKHAYPEGIIEFVNTFGNATDHSLESCRRCPTSVVNAANTLIARNPGRHPKELVVHEENGQGEISVRAYQSPESEATGVINEIERLIEAGEANPGEILILNQRAALGRRFVEECRNRGIPVRSYYNEDAVKSEIAQEKLCILKLLVDRTDRVSLRWLLGMGDDRCRASAYNRIRAYCEERGVELWDCLLSLEDREIQIPYTGGIVQRFREIRREVERLEGGGIEGFVDRWLPEGAAELEELRAISIVAELQSDDLESLLNILMEEILQPEVPMEVAEVRVMSLHKSKGLSAPVVFMTGCVEGLLPYLDRDMTAEQINRAVIEQRRLFYVGMTRVKASPAIGRVGRLFVSSFRTMPIGEALGAQVTYRTARRGHAILAPSRFINEMG